MLLGIVPIPGTTKLNRDDDNIPRNFAPFNVQGVGPNIYVTYAKQDAARHDPVKPGVPGDGFVDVFDQHEKLLQRLEHGEL